MCSTRSDDVARVRARAVCESRGKRAPEREGGGGRAETRGTGTRRDDDGDETTRGDASGKRLLRSARGVEIGGWEGIETRVQTVGA